MYEIETRHRMCVSLEVNMTKSQVDGNYICMWDWVIRSKSDCHTNMMTFWTYIDDDFVQKNRKITHKCPIKHVTRDNFFRIYERIQERRWSRWHIAHLDLDIIRAQRDYKLLWGYVINVWKISISNAWGIHSNDHMTSLGENMMLKYVVSVFTWKK